MLIVFCLLEHPLLPVSYFLRIITAILRKMVTADELNARARANSCQRGIYR
jgi:hypothetical protein